MIARLKDLGKVNADLVGFVHRLTRLLDMDATLVERSSRLRVWTASRLNLLVRGEVVPSEGTATYLGPSASTVIGDGAADVERVRRGAPELLRRARQGRDSIGSG